MSDTFLEEFEKYASEGLSELGLWLPPEAWERIKRYFQTLRDLGIPLGLTALKEPKDFAIKHLLDSLMVVPHLPSGPLLDLGTGAGLPGLLIKIVEPKREVWLVDARKKAVSFLTYVAGLLRLEDLRILQATVGRNDPLPRAYFAVVVSRAVTDLKNLWGLAESLLAPGGQLIALKGPRAPEEAEALKRPDLRVDLIPLELPLLHATRNLVKISRHENRQGRV